MQTSSVCIILTERPRCAALRSPLSEIFYMGNDSALFGANKALPEILGSQSFRTHSVPTHLSNRSVVPSRVEQHRITRICRDSIGTLSHSGLHGHNIPR